MPEKLEDIIGKFVEFKELRYPTDIFYSPSSEKRCCMLVSVLIEHGIKSSPVLGELKS